MEYSVVLGNLGVQAQMTRTNSVAGIYLHQVCFSHEHFCVVQLKGASEIVVLFIDGE